jgi:hypothetical protein
VIQNTGTGDRRQETGDRKQETGNRKQETGNRRQETGDRRQAPNYLPFEKGDRGEFPPLSPITSLSSNLFPSFFSTATCAKSLHRLYSKHNV